MTKLHPCVEASNNLTSKYVEFFPQHENSVFSGSCAYILLLMALIGAQGKARKELEDSLNVPKEAAIDSLRTILKLVEVEGMTSASGLWTKSNIPLKTNYCDAVAPTTVAHLPRDLNALHKWVSTKTGGLIQEFPIAFSKDTLMALATTILAMSDWAKPFEETFDHWSGQDDLCDWLYQHDSELDRAALITKSDMTISRLICESKGGFDVHLIAGNEHAAPSDVLRIGIETLAGDAKIITGSQMHEGMKGGCLNVARENTTEPKKRLQISLPVFEVTATHDLTQQAEIFGLISAMDNSRGHFPDISDDPLAVETVKQVTKANFSADGFKAAAVTAMGIRAGGIPETFPATIIKLNFNYPFGFLVVERQSRLVAFAGWILTIGKSKTLQTVKIGLKEGEIVSQ